MQKLLLPVALLQVLVPLLPVFGIGQSIGARATQGNIPPELPPGVFFAIWSIIFGLYIWLAIIALIGKSYTLRQVAGPLVIAGMGNVIWMLSRQMLGIEWLELLILLIVVYGSWLAAYRVDRIGGWDGTFFRLGVCALVGLLAGWASVAVSISIPGIVRDVSSLNPTDSVWISLWCALVPATLMAWAFASRISHSGWYFVALGWGLLGIVDNNLTRTGTHGLGIAAACVGLYIIWRRIRFGASGSATPATI